MLQLHPYLLFDGTCTEAMRFYERTLGGTLEAMTTVGESPMAGQFPRQRHDRVLHARLAFGGNVLMASDWMAAASYPGMSGFRCMLSFPAAEQARRVFDALAEGGEVQQAMRKTPWAEAFGMVVDRYGVPWQLITTETPK
jgi:PhnB protein